MPELPRLVRAGHPDDGLVGHVEQAGDRHAERVGDLGQGGQVRVGPCCSSATSTPLLTPERCAR